LDIRPIREPVVGSGRFFSCQRNHLPDKPGAFGYITGDHSRLLSDGTYHYDCDAEGNPTRRTEIATGEVTEYTRDHRNRLVRVSTRTTGNEPLTIDTFYVYDTQNRWIARSHDSDGDGVQASLPGLAVDQILADEQNRQPPDLRRLRPPPPTPRN
jgi:YD repeat-containing protein